MRRWLPIAAICCALPALASAQDPAATQRERMKAFGFLAGEWEGEGWAVTPDGVRHEFLQHESVQYKLDGGALLIEGTGTAKQTGEVSFRAIGLIFFDPTAGAFRMHSGTTEGRSGDSTVKVTDGGFEWSPDAVQGRVRYTMRLTEKGEWSEKGEFSRDGTSWQPFHEMTLRKIR